MGMSREFAETWSDWANTGIILAAVLGVVSTGLAIWTGNVKEAYSKLDIAKLTNSSEFLRAQNLALQSKIAPRSLSIEQQQAIANSLKFFSGQKVSVSTYALDAEAAMLAKQIIACMKSAGINSEDQTASIMPLGGFAVGVHVSGTEALAIRVFGSSLREIGGLLVAEDASGASIQSGPDFAAKAEAPAVTILVGVKPVPIIK